jgi:hypothetical protein
MKMNGSIGRMLLMVLAILTLAIAPVYAAGTGFYTGFQIGPNFSNSYGTAVNGSSTSNFKFDTGVAVGGQVGYDFAYLPNAPKYAKYFGVSMDYMWNGLNTNGVYGIGNQNALSFLGIVKYPINTSKEYPGGKLAPYIGVGPGVVWTSLNGANATNAALVVEPGIRYMLTPKFSVDGAYRFRTCQPTFSNVKTKTNLNNNMLLVKVNYHF